MYVKIKVHDHKKASSNEVDIVALLHDGNTPKDNLEKKQDVKSGA